MQEDLHAGIIIGMDQYAFEAYLDSFPHTPTTEATGRFVTDAFGMDVRVVLPREYWMYFDWLARDQGIDMGPWVTHCDINRGAYTLSHALMHTLWEDNAARKASGHNVPPTFIVID